jgi:catechol 2,3-dioxygenase-like lactoylglutathione lyase family enzyme
MRADGRVQTRAQAPENSGLKGKSMKRLHVHVAVTDISQSVGFYSALFATKPDVVKTDYAKWMLEDPRVNFAISTRGREPGLDHLGIQVEDTVELNEVYARLRQAGGNIIEQGATACCYAKSEKSWIDDPAGISWETFLTTGESINYGDGTGENAARVAHGKQSACCVPQAAAAPAPAASACCTS